MKWADEWMGGCTEERLEEWANGWMKEWMERMEERMGQRMDAPLPDGRVLVGEQGSQEVHAHREGGRLCQLDGANLAEFLEKTSSKQPKLQQHTGRGNKKNG